MTLSKITHKKNLVAKKFDKELFVINYKNLFKALITFHSAHSCTVFSLTYFTNCVNKHNVHSKNIM